MRNYIKNVAILCKGDYAKMHRHLLEKKPVANYSCVDTYLTIVDAAYPKRLLELDQPPFILFYQGNLSLLNSSCVGVVGSRKPSLYAVKATYEAVAVLRERYTIVSGLAYGIDVCAHLCAIHHHTIAVVACGLDICYPMAHRDIFNQIGKHHLIISEYPRGVNPERYHFPFRNRIIASLSKCIYIMSARQKSGTMGTVDIALSLNREIVVLPHPIHDESGSGCNQLIQEGATVLTNIKELSNI